MDSNYALGIDELDAQHEGIERVCIAIGEAGDGERCHSLLDELYERMRFHFYAEESVMRIFSYPESQEHQRSHLEILKRIDGYRKIALTEADIEMLKVLPMQLFREQILAQDMRFAAYLKRTKERQGVQ